MPQKLLYVSVKVQIRPVSSFRGTLYLFHKKLKLKPNNSAPMSGSLIDLHKHSNDLNIENYVNIIQK